MSTPVLDWTIDNFLDKSDKVLSPIFTIPEHPQIEWRLQLHPRGDGPDSSDFVSVYLCKMTVEFEAEIDFELVMVGSDAQAESKILKHTFESEKWLVPWGFPKFVSKSRLISDLLVDGNLKIQMKNAQVIRVFEVKDCLNATVFDWEIDNFLSIKEAKLTSDKFTIPGYPLIKWQMICHPKGKESKKSDSNDNLKIYIQKCTDDCEIEIEFRSTIAGSQGKRLSRIDRCNFKVQNNSIKLSIQQVLLNDENYLINGMLKIRFKVFRVIKVVYQDNYLNHLYNKDSLNLDSTNNKLCDFRLKTGDKSFAVHKYVLAKESPYFRKMFDSEFKENDENEVDLSQFQEDVIQEVLRFIYTGQLHNFDDLSDQLIIAADYFQMDYFKILCQENMSFRFLLSNCLEFLKIAEQVNATPLKEAAMRYLKKNKNRMNKQTLIKFFKEHTELGVEWILWINY